MGESNRIEALSANGADLSWFESTLESYKQKCADFISLTKPGVMTLLLISTGCPMLLAAGGTLSWKIALSAIFGGALVSGSASAINCIWDRDIDAIMSRTKNRPLAAGRLSPVSALLFSLVLGLVGLAVLGYQLNPLAAGVALFGHFFYVFVYTMWLKRTTPQNIVIGGAAGAVPPIVGWVAVTGSIDLTALLLFLVVFLWTPPHFWALALNKNNDYQRAGVPMLPVVAGEKVTLNQMYWYSLSLIPVIGLLTVVNAELGWFFGVVMTGVNVIFSYLIYDLRSLPATMTEQKTEKAWRVFNFSLIHLTLFFVCLVIDSTVI